MAANIEKNSNGWFRALISCVAQFLRLKFPLWLYIVAFLACVLFTLLVACTASKANVQTAIVGVTEYRGHSFLVFRAVNCDDGSISVVHDPDCECNFVDIVKDLSGNYGTN
jgi:hypothetical protein